jgi:predicted phage terminase large subunit-like protein
MTPDEQAAVLSGLPMATIKRLARERACMLSFAHYVKAAWVIHHAHEPLQWGRYLDVVCNHLQALIEERLSETTLVVNLPPGLAKSYISSVCLPAWILAREPWRRLLCSTAVDKNLYRDSRRCQDQINSDWYQRAFRRRRWGLKSGAMALGYWQTSEHGERVSVTPRQGLTGAKVHYGLGDDILDAEDAHRGSAEMERLPGWWDKTWSTRMVHSTSPQLLMGQRLSEADPYAHVLRTVPCEHVCLPAEFDGERRSTSLGEYDWRTEEGELLAPLRYDEAAIEGWKTKLGPAGYSAQFQQRPTPIDGLMFDSSWLQYWTTPPDRFDFMFTSWDTGYREGRRNDYTCGQLWGFVGRAAYLLAQLRGIWNPDRMEREVIKLASRATCIAHHIENEAAGPGLIRALAGVVDRVQPAHARDRSKPARAAAIVPIWAALRVWLPHPHEAIDTVWQPEGYEWVASDYVPELLAFPLGSKDDQVDATSQALGLAFGDEGPDIPPVEY